MADVTISVTIPDALVPRAAAFIRQFDWDGQSAIGSDATVSQVKTRAKEITAFFWKMNIRNYERMQPSAELDGIT
jgi:hypothetical protein